MRTPRASSTSTLPISTARRTFPAREGTAARSCARSHDVGREGDQRVRVWRCASRSSSAALSDPKLETLSVRWTGTAHASTIPSQPKPFTQYPTPYTLHPTPNALHPKPRTLNPTPYTLHSEPLTLHPRGGAETRRCRDGSRKPGWDRRLARDTRAVCGR